MKSLSDINIEKSRSGVYKDNEENRRLHRVGQRYGQPKKKESSKGTSSLPTKEDEKKGKPEQAPVEQPSSDEGVFTRVSFPDMPNSGKVNLKKYLSDKRKKAVDEAWNKAGFDRVTRERAGVFQEGYNKLREQFNNNFDDMSKSERAELLYKILKMKNAMKKGGRGPNNSKNSVSEVLTPNNPLAKYIDTTKIPRPRPGARYVVKQGQPPRTLVKVLDYHSGIGGYGVTVEYRGDGDEKTGTETIDRDVFTRIFYNYKKLGNKK